MTEFVPIDTLTVLLQNCADPAIRNSDGKSPLDLAEPTAKLVLSGEYKKDKLLEAARTGNEEVLMALITPLNVNCHAEDGRKVCVCVLQAVRGRSGPPFLSSCLFSPKHLMVPSVLGGIVEEMHLLESLLTVLICVNDDKLVPHLCTPGIS